MSSFVAKSVDGERLTASFVITLDVDDYVTMRTALWRSRNRPNGPRRWLARSVQVMIGLSIAIIAFLFAPSRYIALAGAIFALQAALALIAPNAVVIRVIRGFAAAAIGILLLLWPYTVPFGVLVLLILVVFILGHRFVRGSTQREYRKSRLFRQPFECGFDEESIWFGSPTLMSRCQWADLNWCKVCNEWLVLQLVGMPLVLLPVEALRANEMFDRILALARTHANAVSPHSA